jgi:hypothetical protein
VEGETKEFIMIEDAATTVPGGFRPEDISAHSEHDHMAAVFADRAHAVAAVDDLRSLGLGSEHLGIAVAGDDTVAFEHDADREMLHDAEVGAAAGVPIGALAGMGLAGLVVPGLGVIGVGGMLAIAGASALWGGVLGAYFGTTAGETAWVEHEDMGYTRLEGDEVLVVVCSHGHGDAVRDVMQRHDGRLRTIEAGKL